MATNGAIDSKWCNWELGFGDAQKYDRHIALLPMKPEGTCDENYKGNEYMRIYPHIVYFDGTEKYDERTTIPRGYYVRTVTKYGYSVTSLDKWFIDR